MPSSDEIQRRERAARDAIRNAFGTSDDEFGASMFVFHHLKEMEPEYWKRHVGTESPEPSSVLDLLVLRSHWGGEEDIEIFDFTLPEDTTNYVLGVSFGATGEVVAINMES